MNEQQTLLLAEYVAKLLLHVNCDEEKPKKPDNIPWQAVYAFAKAHSLASGIYSSVEEEVKAEAPELTDAWDMERAADFAKHIKQSSEFARLTRALSEQKIKFLPLKGFIYKALWKNPAHRTMSDMDIYIHPDDFPEADKLFKSLGYIQEHGCDVHINYEKKPFVKVEAHRKFVENGPAISFNTWVSKPENPYWYIMNHEQFLLFNTEHAKKHYESGGCGMRVIFDLYLYKKRFGAEIDRESLEGAMERDGLLDFFRTLEGLADYWFSGAQTDDKMKRTACYVATGGTYGTHENGVSYGIERKGRLGYIFSRVFPPYKRMRLRYPILRKLPILLPFMYIVRFVTSIFNGRNGLELRGIKKAQEKNKQ